ncbi:MAG: TIGR01212 family radical SAM protein [Lachnospiraceae bacterium]|nr:TIGR01212 family radical SAM protein [Lachnospiraceae bacterium]
MERSTTNWHGKPYYSLDAYCKNEFAHKCYKIALNGGMTCPNRDGTLDSRGCIFCSAGGSGDFAASGASVSEQLEKGKSLFRGKKTGEHYIAYFQAYTNTYATIDYLEKVYTQALSCPEVVGISIATRPDCLEDKVLALLDTLRECFPQKFIWIELGLQTIHQSTAQYIRRGYPLSCFEAAIQRLQEYGFPYIVHVILGLPGESPEMIYDTIRYLNIHKPFGIKLQLLHVLSGTDLAVDYEAGLFKTYEKDEYLDILIHCLELLSPDIVVHRLTGDGPRSLLIAPTWSLNKRDVLNSLHTKMKQANTYQGRLFDATESIDFI